VQQLVATAVYGLDVDVGVLADERQQDASLGAGK